MCSFLVRLFSYFVDHLLINLHLLLFSARVFFVDYGRTSRFLAIFLKILFSPVKLALKVLAHGSILVLQIWKAYRNRQLRIRGMESCVSII